MQQSDSIYLFHITIRAIKLKSAPGKCLPLRAFLAINLFAIVTRFRSLMSMLCLSYFGPFLRQIRNLLNSRYFRMRVSFN
ncbi:hypothetical protein HanRHA438_Chr04g0164861 [Helianthus annuus]|nr:hypothetical protein HanRHA438_Chr04g0164861 [Helianthus annuus]